MEYTQTGCCRNGNRTQRIIYCALTAFMVIGIALVISVPLATGQRVIKGQPVVNKRDIPVKGVDYRLEQGYTVERVVSGLTYPTSMAVGPEGSIYISEIEVPGGNRLQGNRSRLVRVTADGTATTLAKGLKGFVTGLTYEGNALYAVLSSYKGQVIRVDGDGGIKVLADNLPSGGDNPTGDIVSGTDGKLYFGVGTATNSGIVGQDNDWRGVNKGFHDMPSRDFTLVGTDYRTGQSYTGAFQPYGIRTWRGQKLRKAEMPSGVVMRCNPDGSAVEVYADGLRFPCGLARTEDGVLFVANRGFEDRGSRPIANDWDTIWQLSGGWYGWPDFAGGQPVTNGKFTPKGLSKRSFLLAEHPKLAEQKPLFKVDAGSALWKFDISPGKDFGYKDQAFIALFGGYGKGFKVIRADLGTGKYDNFYTNLKPGSDGGGIERPAAVKFAGDGRSLYVVDAGVIDMDNGSQRPKAKTGGIWRIYKGSPSGSAVAEPIRRDNLTPDSTGTQGRIRTTLSVVVLIILAAVIYMVFKRRRV